MGVCGRNCFRNSSMVGARIPCSPTSVQNKMGNITESVKHKVTIHQIMVNERGTRVLPICRSHERILLLSIIN